MSVTDIPYVSNGHCRIYFKIKFMPLNPVKLNIGHYGEINKCLKYLILKRISNLCSLIWSIIDFSSSMLMSGSIFVRY